MFDQQERISDSANAEDVATHPEEPRRARSWADHAAAAEAWERQHEAEWARIDQKLRGIAARRAALDAEEANLLRYAEELKLWRAYGFGSLVEYMERVMGYAPRTATERLRVARAIAELPLIAEALERGELAHSAVRELSRVAVPDTEEAWLEAARGKSLREVEAMVSGHKPGHLPTDETEPSLHRKTLTLEVSPETYDLWRRMHALAAEEHGQRLSDDELIQSVFRRAYGDGSSGTSSDGCHDGVGGNGGSSGTSGDSGSNVNRHRRAVGTPAYKIAIKQCPDCKRAWQYSGGRDIEIDPAVAECAACDAVHLGSLDAGSLERATTTVTPRKREQVLARDGHCCAVPGCRRNIGLDLHHVEYQSHGGSHELSNLTTICDLHHRAIHFGKLLIRGTAPDHLTFEFRKPRDRRNVTDDDGPTPPSPHCSPPAVRTAPTQAVSPPERIIASAGATCATWIPYDQPSPGAVDPPALDVAHEPRATTRPLQPDTPTWALDHQPPHGAARPALDAECEPSTTHSLRPTVPMSALARQPPHGIDRPTHDAACEPSPHPSSVSSAGATRTPYSQPSHGAVDPPALDVAHEPRAVTRPLQSDTPTWTLTHQPPHGIARPTLDGVRVPSPQPPALDTIDEPRPTVLALLPDAPTWALDDQPTSNHRDSP
ncbi:MAG TPA: hypothetical protein VNO30_26090 [Kofleriaceae bacterium]|nr:hypothetical protein [Kofleriaceae bacterium]